MTVHPRKLQQGPPVALLPRAGLLALVPKLVQDAIFDGVEIVLHEPQSHAAASREVGTVARVRVPSELQTSQSALHHFLLLPPALA